MHFRIAVLSSSSCERVHPLLFGLRVPLIRLTHASSLKSHLVEGKRMLRAHAADDTYSEPAHDAAQTLTPTYEYVDAYVYVTFAACEYYNIITPFKCSSTKSSSSSSNMNTTRAHFAEGNSFR